LDDQHILKEEILVELACASEQKCWTSHPRSLEAGSCSLRRGNFCLGWNLQFWWNYMY